MLKKIREYIATTFIHDNLTETELSYATTLTKNIILEARRNSLKVGDRLIGIAGDEYMVIAIPNNQYTLINIFSGESSALVFNSLSELTLACKTCNLVKDEDWS